MGIGAVIGSGIFTVIGTAISGEQFDTSSVLNTPLADFLIRHSAMAGRPGAGPAIALSLMLVAIVCALTGLCYAELASMIPIAGSAYTYAYATMGEFVAWIIGWDLVLEYAVGAATVSVSWSRYVVSLLGQWGINLPAAVTLSPFDAATLPDGSTAQGFVNLPAVFIIAMISLLLMRGISASARVNNTIVAVKLAVVAAVICVGAFYVKAQNYVPFIPENTGTFGEFGWSGIMRGAGVIFFAYIGFDAVSTAAQEARDPQRDMSRGILGSLVICTVLYIAFALVLTGMVYYQAMRGDAAPVATAIDMTPFPWLKVAVKLGIICGFTTVILVMLLGQSRVFYAMSGDGLLPGIFARLHPSWRTPYLSNIAFMIFTGALAGFVPISNLGHMTSIGTLLAFVIVCGGVMVLRSRKPEVKRGYRVPFSPVTPILGILVCFAMMASLDVATWYRLVIWLAIGLVIYFGYSRSRSRLGHRAGRAAT